jgi:hypothetical protein
MALANAGDESLLISGQRENRHFAVWVSPVNEWQAVRERAHRS